MGRIEEIYCDRCRNTLDGEGIRKHINHITIETPEDFIDYELCDDCYKKLMVLLDAFEDESNTFVVQDPFGNELQEIPGWQPSSQQKNNKIISKETEEIELPIKIGGGHNYGFMEDPN